MFADPPLNPGSEQARKLLEHELSKPKYGDRRNLLERFVSWLMSELRDLGDGVGTLPVRWLVLILAVLAVLIGLGLSRVRRRQGARGSDDERDELIERELTAAQLRKEAARLLDEGDLAGALIQMFRTMVRRGVERALVPARPAATAHEVARELAAAFPDHDDELERAGSLFDAVRYGGRVPDRSQVQALADLEATLDRTRPHRTLLQDPPAERTPA